MKNKYNYIPKVGDVVELVNSGENITEEMIEIVNNLKHVIITEVISDPDRIYKIKFKGCNNWCWALQNNHFRPVQTCREIDNLKPLLKILNEIKLDKDV